MADQTEASRANIPKLQFRRFIPEMLVILLVLSWLAARMMPTSANRQRRAVQAIEQHGGKVRYDYQKQAGQIEPEYNSQVTPPGPAPLRWFLGKHYFASAVYVSVGRTTDNCLARLVDLPDIEHAMLDGGTGNDLSNLQKLSKVRYLSLKRFAALDVEDSLLGTRTFSQFRNPGSELRPIWRS